MAICHQKIQLKIFQESLIQAANRELRTPFALNGNIARRKVGRTEIEHWDEELPGYGLRVFPSGRKTWFVMLRQRRRQRRISLGHVGEVSATEARRLARAELAKVALDGLPVASAGKGRNGKPAPTMRKYAKRFWADYARHWKPSTQERNRKAINNDILPHFGDQRVDELCKSDILLWKDGFAIGLVSSTAHSPFWL